MVQAGHLFKKHRQTVLRYLSRISGNPDLAEELSQEVFLRAHKYGEKFKVDRGSEGSWLLGIARNVFYTHVSRKSNQSIHLEDSFWQNVPASESANEESGGVPEMIRKIVRDLPEPERSIILEKQLGKKSLKEVARCLKISERTVNRRMISAFEMLRERLEDRGIRPDNWRTML